MSDKRTGILCQCLLTVVLAGCGASNDYFYTLTSNAGENRSGSGTATAPSIVVGPVVLPEIADRPQIVTRVGSNQVTVSEHHRWAASLKSEIPRVIAQNLSDLLGAKSIFSYEDGGSAHADIQVLVDMRSFDARLGETVMIDALWTIRSATGQPMLGRSEVQEPIGGHGYDALVSAHSRALVVLSRQIAEAIRVGNTTGP